MASSVCRSCFFLLTLLTILGFLAQVSYGRSIVVSSNSAEKVSMDLYYESLCPGCEDFILNFVDTIFKNGIIDIVDLKLYPWGNARFTSDTTFACQHGTKECYFNIIEACAIDAWPSLSVHFPFIYCVEKLLNEGNSSKWETCFETLQLDPTPVKDCYTNGLGNQLELKYGAVTKSLTPRKTYVPWVVVDGQPLYLDYENFTDYICKAYKGPTPSACNDLSSNNALKKKIKQVPTVSFSDREVEAAAMLANVKSSVRSGLTGVVDKAVMYTTLWL